MGGFSFRMLERMNISTSWSSPWSSDAAAAAHEKSEYRKTLQKNHTHTHTYMRTHTKEKPNVGHHHFELEKMLRILSTNNVCVWLIDHRVRSYLKYKFIISFFFICRICCFYTHKLHPLPLCDHFLIRWHLFAETCTVRGAARRGVAWRGAAFCTPFICCADKKFLVLFSGLYIFSFVGWLLVVWISYNFFCDKR